MKNGGGLTLTLSIAAVFATSIAVVCLFGYFSDRAKGFGSFYSGPAPEFNIPVVELVATAANNRNDQSRAVLSSEFSSRSFKPTLTVSVCFVCVCIYIYHLSLSNRYTHIFCR